MVLWWLLRIDFTQHLLLYLANYQKMFLYADEYVARLYAPASSLA